MQRFHYERPDMLVWGDEADFDALLLELTALADHGLDPGHYHLARLLERRNDRPARDALATDAWFSAAAHMVDGKVDPVSVEPNWTAARRSADLNAQLTHALRNHRVAGSLTDLAPRQNEYRRLVARLRELRADHELSPELANDEKSRRELDQLRVNLERWRWLPDDLGRRHVRANIADFRLQAWENGKVVRTHKVIVGRRYRKTPVFSSQIQYLVLNPWWETPPSLARQDKLPLFQRDPGAVRRMGFQVLDRQGVQVNPQQIEWKRVSPNRFPYRLRQAPGEQNALGQIKIMFPNEHNVYLHDTPTRNLFERNERMFSSGCLRVQDPVGLASWLLGKDNGWSRDRLDGVIASKAERKVNLPARVPVHILYFTAVSDDDGGVRLLPDIYERDRAVLEGLLSPPNPVSLPV
ncbi:MAG: L,D-transpeptidase family protein [Burkholderiaceae bacterium]